MKQKGKHAMGFSPIGLRQKKMYEGSDMDIRTTQVNITRVYNSECYERRAIKQMYKDAALKRRCWCPPWFL